MLLAELVCALLLLGRPVRPAAPLVAAPGPTGLTSTAVHQQLTPRTVALPAGRSATLIALGADGALADRIAAELAPAVDAVTAFWGPDWRRDVVVAVAGTDAQFVALAGLPPDGHTDIAAVTTGERILFAPGAAAMPAADLRIVLRHELFHYAARADTAADAPRWLTEGVADYVARPAPAAPLPGIRPLRLPTDADLDTVGPVRSAAYDRAWLFTRYVADRWGVAALRKLYRTACGPGHPDVTTAVRSALGTGIGEVEAGWRTWTPR